ncbi:MAG TPA: protein-L-isoaspartate(D-aspartate) O-methyltransferase [Halothiobacillus sp.]|jgi:protein-L-isoaspartate(D-aspartate) O-methyltransferase|nr:protein-L-isoaspartate(D-aspartate) O-methyltransferase [Halothiobacillus sp.]
MTGMFRRDYSWARAAMVERLRAQGITNPTVLTAMNTVAREEFVDEALRMRVYEDCSLPIGQGQTLSQPYIVARMTELVLAAGIPVKRVLEIGTGSGYQAAVLAHCVSSVFTIERIGAFLDVAKQRHRALGLGNIRYMHSDGFKGWPSQAPFDGILVTAAPPTIPDELKAQLSVGARLIVPVGQQGEAQRLTVITRTDKDFRSQYFDAVSFVPMLPGEMS